MKYESETGESMEKPGKKLKKLLIITGTTGAVYAGCLLYTSRIGAGNGIVLI